jgi:hypothetical protein
MKLPIGTRKAFAVLVTAAAVFTLFFAVLRPRFLRWGATDAETRVVLVGDERVPFPYQQTTRALTITAPVDRVWPWLAQLGQDRGGFYSYEILEDMVGCEMPRATRIVPRHQGWKPGDQLWMYPPEKLDGLGGAPLVSAQPGRHLVFATRLIGSRAESPPRGVWGFYLEPIGDRATRFVVRGRAPGDEMGPLGLAAYHGLFEPAHYVMERRMMLTIKALAEGRPTSKPWDDVAVALWTLTVVLMIAALVEVARRTRWVRPLVVAAGAALVFQFLTLLQPPPVLGVALVLGLGCALWGNAATPARGSSGSP